MSRPRTRPHPLDPGILEALQERLIAGESITRICEDSAMPTKAAVYLTMAKDPAFKTGIAHAREAQQEAIIDETIDIADAVDPEKRGAVEKARLQIWARQWRAAKLAPNTSPGSTNGQLPSPMALVGAVIGSRQTNSAPAGANTCAYG